MHTPWFSEAAFASRFKRLKQQKAWRQPHGFADNSHFINFSGHDYLGLSQHGAVKAAAQKVIQENGVGSTGSALVCGHSHYHAALEQELAAFLHQPKALLFHSGYSANLAVLGTLLLGQGAIFLDRLSHASLIEGALHSGVYFRRFQHKKVAQLSQWLGQHKGKPIMVATDGVFSMDGDEAPLRELAKLCQQQGALLYVDDAHGFGVLGPQGKGTAAKAGVPTSQLPLTMVTLSKALGVAGAAVVGKAHLIDALIQYAKPYIYTTAMPPAMAAAGLAALNVMQEEPWRQEKVLALAQYFRQEAHHMGYTVAPSNTPIQPLILGSNEAALSLSYWLRDSGMWAVAIRPPTVPEGSARVRISFSALHKKADVRRLLAALYDYSKAHWRL